LANCGCTKCDVARIDTFFGELEPARAQAQHPDGSASDKPRYAANTRRTIRSIVAGVMQQAVLHNAIAANPVRDLERIESPNGQRKGPPRGLTAEERGSFVHADLDTVTARCTARSRPVTRSPGPVSKPSPTRVTSAPLPA
jgi:hypothetical protein